MNRLLRISFDILLTSITPILGWFLLGILVDKNLISIFSLVYPMQFVISGIYSIFGTGANISAVRDKNPNSTFSGLVLGSITGFLILGAVCLNIDGYIFFMNMEVGIYRVFALYAIGQMFLQLLLNLSLCKMYYEGRNKTANKYCFWFNLINFLTLVIMSIITKEQMIIAIVSITCTSLFVIFMMVKTVKVTRFKINLLSCIKYDSSYLFAEISMFIIYLFGFKNAFNYGDKYVFAISFATLITDTQWDIGGAIKTVAQIDIAKKEFSYKEHIKNSMKLTYILIASSGIMGLILYPFYEVDLTVVLIVAVMELACMYKYPIYITKLQFIQLECSALKATISKQIANGFRVICSFIPSPFCTSIGLVISAIFQLVFTQYLIKKNKLNMEMKEEKTYELR